VRKNVFTEKQIFEIEKIETYNKKTSENIIKIGFVKNLLEISNKNINNENLKLWLSLFCIYRFCKEYYKNEKVLKHMKYYSEIILQIFDVNKVYFCLLFIHMNNPGSIKKEILELDFEGKDGFLRLFP
jgi:hypothetical protein